MKFIDRYVVEGTDPTVYIGHRTYRKPNGAVAVSRTWYAEYCHHGGREYEALGERNKQAAIRKVHQIMDRLERGDAKPITHRLEWTELRDKYMTFQRNRNRRPTTLRKYGTGLDRLLEFTAGQNIRYPEQFTLDHFWAYSQWLREEHKSGEKTIFDYLMFVKQVYKWAAIKGKLLIHNPLAGETVDEPERTEQPCFNAQQIAQILENASAEDRPVFAIMAYTGMRFGEVRDLRWSDLQLNVGQHGKIFLKRGGSANTTKGKSNRMIPIDAELKNILDTVPQKGELVFYEPAHTLRDPSKLTPLVERKLLARLKHTCKVCGFANPKQYKLHTFRHAFASLCARDNISPKYALNWLGHKSSDIFDHYVTLYDEDAEAAMASIGFNRATPPQRRP